MKKIIMALATVITLTPGAFAGKYEIDPDILAAFNKRFAGAKDVTWLTGRNYYKAIFTYEGARLFAYYNPSGIMLGLANYMSPLQLPEHLQKGLRRDYPSYWITDLFKMVICDETNYYITLENADDKLILESSGGNNWKTYHQ